MGDDYILRFDVSMQNRVIMHFLQPQTDLPQSQRRLVSAQFFLLLYVAKQAAPLHVFHNDVEICEIVEKTIKFD